MKIWKLVGAAAISVAAMACAASAATTYKAFSNERDGTIDDVANVHVTGDTHSVWFAGTNPPGVTGNKPNHFLFEFAEPGYGSLTVDGDNATLTGDVRNEDGQGFSLVMNLLRITDGRPIGSKVVGGASTADWSWWELNANKENSLTSLTGTSLGNYDISLRGSNGDGPFYVQLGTGANDKDKDLFGLSSWIKLTSQANSSVHYNGDINIRLEVVPLPAGILLLPAGLVMLGAVKRRRTRPSA